MDGGEGNREDEGEGRDLSARERAVMSGRQGRAESVRREEGGEGEGAGGMGLGGRKKMNGARE